MRVAIVVMAATAAALLASCADEPPASPVAAEAQPAADPYDGPMYVEPDYSDNATVMAQSAAAALALECDTEPYAGGSGDYADGGLETVQDSPIRALQNYLTESYVWQPIPQTGYQVEREDGDRVLMSYDVDGETKVAFIAAKGIRDWDDNTGWGIESWSECDPAELPAEIADGANVGVWTDPTGTRAPVAEIRSFQGPEHCDWQDITFLQIGPENKSDDYLRDVDGDLADYLKTTFASGVRLPDDATDTGYQRNGQELWVVPSKQAAYLVRSDNPDDVERWPAAKDSIGCE